MSEDIKLDEKTKHYLKLIGCLCFPLLIIIGILVLIVVNTSFYYEYDDLCKREICSSKYIYNAYVSNIIYNQSEYYYPVHFVVTKNNQIIFKDFEMNIVKNDIDKYHIQISNEIKLYQNCNNLKDNKLYLENQYKYFDKPHTNDCGFSALLGLFDLVFGFILLFSAFGFIVMITTTNIDKEFIICFNNFNKNKDMRTKKIKKFFKKIRKKIKKFFKKLYCCKNKNNFTEMEFVPKNNSPISSDDEGSYSNTQDVNEYEFDKRGYLPDDV